MINFEQMAGLRAYARSPIGTIKTFETVDGQNGVNLSAFRRHDEGHFVEWLKNIENIAQFYDVNVVKLFEQTSAFFEKIRSHLNEISKPSEKVREVFFFMYFVISHEKNIDIISSSRWLYHWNNNFYRKERSEKDLVELPIEQLFPKDVKEFSLVDLNKLAQYYGWDAKITYDEYVAALKLIRDLN